jgi:hypothetical protein
VDYKGKERLGRDLRYVSSPSTTSKPSPVKFVRGLLDLLMTSSAHTLAPQTLL